MSLAMPPRLTRAVSPDHDERGNADREGEQIAAGRGKISGIFLAVSVRRMARVPMNLPP
jgi:hypothetical protein